MVGREIARPILGTDFQSYHAVERRIRPIPDPRHQTVLDRGDVGAVRMTVKIAPVADGMLPIAALPDAASAVGGAAVRNPFAGREAARKRRFDRRAARCEIRITVDSALILTGGAVTPVAGCAFGFNPPALATG